MALLEAFETLLAGRTQGASLLTFEVFHEYPLEFEGYLLSCAKMPGAKESDPDRNIEIRMLNCAQSSAQRVTAQKTVLQHSHARICSNEREL